MPSPKLKTTKVDPSIDQKDRIYDGFIGIWNVMCELNKERYKTQEDDDEAFVKLYSKVYALFLKEFRITEE